MDFLGPFEFDGALRGMLKVCARQDATITDLTEEIHRSPILRRLVRDFVALKTKRDDINNTHRALAILGFLGGRNFVLGCYLHRCQKGDWPVFSDKSDPKVTELLKRARQFEDFCERQQVPGREFAFLVGFLFDVFEASQGKTPLPKALWDKEFPRGVQAAGLASHLAHAHNLLPAPPVAFGLALMPALGRFLALRAYPAADGKASWDTSRAIWENLPPAAQSVTERGSYPLGHADLAALVMRLTGVMSEFDAAVQFYAEPSLLRARDSLVRNAGMLLHLGYFGRAGSQPWWPALKVPDKTWKEATDAGSRSRV